MPINFPRQSIASKQSLWIIQLASRNGRKIQISIESLIFEVDPYSGHKIFLEARYSDNLALFKLFFVIHSLGGRETVPLSFLSLVKLSRSTLKILESDMMLE